MNISFSCPVDGHARVFDAPVPAKECLPDWYKAQVPVLSSRMNERGHYDETVKRCMPVLDAMIAGYILTTQTDIDFILNPDGSHSSRWSVDGFQAIESHSPEQISEVPIPDGYSPYPLKMVNPWIVTTPPGYSCLFTTPMWRTDLPFFVFPGIVDTDKYPRPINFPFLLRSDFDGVVPNATPFVQIIPFKRDEWESTILSEADKRGDVEWQRATRVASHRYKSIWRTLKIWR